MNSLNIGNNVWEWGKKTYTMGILNVTPDSFSDVQMEVISLMRKLL